MYGRTGYAPRIWPGYGLLMGPGYYGIPPYHHQMAGAYPSRISILKNSSKQKITFIFTYKT